MPHSEYPPTDKSFGGTMQDLSDRIDRQARRRTMRRDQMPGYSVRGYLDATYRGWGAAMVRVGDPTAPLTGPYNWRVPYQPNGSRLVALVRTSDGGWDIAGQATDETILLPYDPAMVSIYHERTLDFAWNLRPRATKLAMSGLVVLSGMFQTIGTLASGTLIGVLPEGMRPPIRLIFPMEYGDSARSLDIWTNGNMTLSASPGANAYISLDGIAFHPAGVGTWTNVGSGGSAFGANFGEWTNPAYGPCAYYKDPWGFVWWRGLARVNVTTTLDNTSIVTVPATHRVANEQHFRTTGNNVYSGLGGKNTDGLNWKLGSGGTVGQWISLTGAVFVTADALTLNPWRNASFANGWGQYAGFPIAAYARREDGLAMTKGLVRAGTINASMSAMGEEMWPTGGAIILAAISNQERARMDVTAARNIDVGVGPGALVGRTASNAWFSWDGMKWVP